MADIKLKTITNFSGKAIGEMVLFQDAYSKSQNLLEVDGSTYLRSGEILTGMESTYPEAYEKFGYKGGAWSLTTSGTANTLRKVIFANGQYVATGAAGTVLTSPTGSTWTTRTFGVSVQINGIVFGAGLFVAVGASGTVRTSPDGITWTARTSGTANNLNGVKFSNTLNLFIAVGNTGTIITSPDGITWTTRTSGVSTNLNDIALSETSFGVAAVGDSGTYTTSLNGTSWANRTSRTRTSRNLTAISYINGAFIATGLNGLVIRQLVKNSSSETTFELITFNIRSFNITGSSSDGTFIYVTGTTVGDFTNTAILRSSDGISWDIIANINNFVAQSMAHGVDKVMVGNNGNIYRSSQNSIGSYSQSVQSYPILVPRNFPAATFVCQSMVRGGQTVVAVGNSGVVYSSTNITNWSLRTSNTVQNLNSVVFANNLFISVGTNGAIITSPDGITWTSRTSGTANGLNSTAFGAGLFVSTGNAGTILTSPDGITWTTRTSGTSNSLLNVTFVSDLSLFVAVGSNTTILTSPDGITWTLRSTGIDNTLRTQQDFRRVSFIDGIAYVIGINNVMFKSSDCITWLPADAPTANPTSIEKFDNNLIQFASFTNDYYLSDDGAESGWLVIRNLSARTGGAGRTSRFDQFIMIAMAIDQYALVRQEIGLDDRLAFTTTRVLNHMDLPVEYMRIK